MRSESKSKSASEAIDVAEEASCSIDSRIFATRMKEQQYNYGTSRAPPSTPKAGILSTFTFFRMLKRFMYVYFSNLAQTFFLAVASFEHNGQWFKHVFNIYMTLDTAFPGPFQKITLCLRMSSDLAVVRSFPEPQCFVGMSWVFLCPTVVRFVILVPGDRKCFRDVLNIFIKLKKAL